MRFFYPKFDKLYYYILSIAKEVSIKGGNTPFIVELLTLINKKNLST